MWYVCRVIHAWLTNLVNGTLSTVFCPAPPSVWVGGVTWDPAPSASGQTPPSWLLGTVHCLWWCKPGRWTLLPWAATPHGVLLLPLLVDVSTVSSPVSERGSSCSCCCRADKSWGIFSSCAGALDFLVIGGLESDFSLAILTKWGIFSLSVMLLEALGGFGGAGGGEVTGAPSLEDFWLSNWDMRDLIPGTFLRLSLGILPFSVYGCFSGAPTGGCCSKVGWGGLSSFHSLSGGLHLEWKESRWVLQDM